MPARPPPYRPYNWRETTLRAKCFNTKMKATAGSTLAITLTIQSLVSATALTIPVLAPALVPVFGVPGELVGVYVALLYVGAMFGSLSAGGWITRFGAIRVSQLCLALCVFGLACILTATAPIDRTSLLSGTSVSVRLALR